MARVRAAGGVFAEDPASASLFTTPTRIKICDCYLPRDRSRALRLETFHAKIVLADDRLAYVGSPNILGSGEGTSLEAGVLVDGRAALQG